MPFNIGPMELLLLLFVLFVIVIVVRAILR